MSSFTFLSREDCHAAIQDIIDSHYDEDASSDVLARVAYDEPTALCMAYRVAEVNAVLLRHLTEARGITPNLYAVHVHTHGSTEPALRRGMETTSSITAALLNRDEDTALAFLGALVGQGMLEIASVIVHGLLTMHDLEHEVGAKLCLVER